jgi:hypothetical protein
MACQQSSHFPHVDWVLTRRSMLVQVSSMTSLSPAARPDASSLVSNSGSEAPASTGVFPAYFGASLHDLAWRTVGTLDPDECIAHISKMRDSLPLELGGFHGEGEGSRPRCHGLVHVLVLITSTMRCAPTLTWCTVADSCGRSIFVTQRVRGRAGPCAALQASLRRSEC